ncbi:TIGR01841 family phasin [Sphingomonas sp. CLY1604]|uniref:TIGR01841 family phasin n=1 Tax=Sphingomonas sp. CLY1604 TaxID=3457786 RepID=UPI003FD6D9BA
MDDRVAKPPVKPAKRAGRAVTKRVGLPVPAQPVPLTPTGPVPAPVVERDPAGPVPALVPGAAEPVIAPPEPVVPPTILADPVETTVPSDATAREDAPAPVLQATPTAAKEVIMETIENVTAKTQTAFNDATERAKGAVEKSQKFFEDANEFGKGNIEALVESSKIAVRGFEAMGQDAAAYAKKSFEDATTAARTLSSVKSPTEFLKLQSDYARQAFDAMVQQTSHNTEALLKLAGEVAQPLSNRVALAAEKMKVAA